MNTQSQIKAIAELDGWTAIHHADILESDDGIGCGSLCGVK